MKRKVCLPRGRFLFLFLLIASNSMSLLCHHHHLGPDLECPFVALSVTFEFVSLLEARKLNGPFWLSQQKSQATTTTTRASLSKRATLREMRWNWPQSSSLTTLNTYRIILIIKQPNKRARTCLLLFDSMWA